jgi:hypothetical protein
MIEFFDDYTASMTLNFVVRIGNDAFKSANHFNLLKSSGYYMYRPL